MKNWRLWLGIAISVVCLYLALRSIDFEKALDAAKQANYWFLIPAVAVYFVGVWFRSVRWHYLLKPMKAVSANRLFPAVVIGYMANDVLPVRMGEIVRAYVLGDREKVSKTATFATIIVERLFDGLTMLLFVGVIALVAHLPSVPEELQQALKISGVVIIGGMLVVIAVTSSRRLIDRTVAVVSRFVPEKGRGGFAAKAGSFVDGFGATQSVTVSAAVLLFSVIAWLCEASMYYLLSIAFGLELPFYVLALTTAVANLVSMVPSSPGYIGPFDWACLLVLVNLFGADANVSASFTIVLHLTLLVPVILLGLYYMWAYNLSLGQARLANTPSSSELDGATEIQVGD